MTDLELYYGIHEHLIYPYTTTKSSFESIFCLYSDANFQNLFSFFPVKILSKYNFSSFNMFNVLSDVSRINLYKKYIPSLANFEAMTQLLTPPP